MAIKVIALLSVLGYVASAEPFQFGYNIPEMGIGKIVGGSDAKIGQFPHQVSVQIRASPLKEFEHFCGGSIINSQWILTAAHCAKISSFRTLIIKAGKLVIPETEDTEQSINVSKAFVHKDYAGPFVGPWDIALIKLSSPLKFNKNVAPINLPSPGSIPTGNATVSGWGSISTTLPPVYSPTLQHVDLPLINMADCKRILVKVHDTNICAGPLTGGYSSCYGDSGGPLIRKRSDGENELIGIVSWGPTLCASAGSPSVYTRVSAFNDWISSIVDSN